MSSGQYDLNRVNPSSFDQFVVKSRKGGRRIWPSLTKFGQVEPHFISLKPAPGPMPPSLQRTLQIVDAPPLGLLFLRGKKMNREAIGAKHVECNARYPARSAAFMPLQRSRAKEHATPKRDESRAPFGADAFRACIGCLIGPLLPADGRMRRL